MPTVKNKKTNEKTKANVPKVQKQKGFMKNSQWLNSKKNKNQWNNGHTVQVSCKSRPVRKS